MKETKATDDKAMKKITFSILAAAALVLCSCKEHYTSYDDAEYIMFADTLKAYAVTADQDYIRIPVVSTVKRDYPRTIAVEVLDKESSAIESLHYSIESNTLTIPAGENRTDLLIQGNFENLSPEENLQLSLSLIMNDKLESPLYGRKTKVELVKCCPFDRQNFCGWCVLSSTFLQNFNPYGSYQRLIHTEAHPNKENSIICRNWMNDGYDVVLNFDTSDPLNPKVSLDGEQIISDEGSFFGMTHGDDHIRAVTSSLYNSYYYNCGSYLFIWTQMYVLDLAEVIGSVGHFYNIMEWISDEEAERLQREEGM